MTEERDLRHAPDIPTWLLRDLMLWRGLAILLLVCILGFMSISHMLDIRTERETRLRLAQERAEDNRSRAEHWTRVELAVKANGDAINTVGGDLRACTICHAHPNIDEMLRKMREQRRKQQP
jgi:hypothetical protein